MRTRLTGPDLIPWLVVFCIGAFAPPCIGAQDEPQPEPTAAPAPAEPEALDLASLAGRDLLSFVLIELQRDYRAGLMDSDFEFAGILLEVAHELRPDDAEIVRLLVEAHSRAGNRERAEELTRRVIRIDPRDTPAQLRLIADRIGALQTVDERLDAYDRFLGPRGSGLDPSVRSRLALDAALLLREQGQLRAFADRLTLALQLDPTNKTAATLAAAFYTERLDDAPGRLEMLLSLLYADPLDHDTHLAIARQLAAEWDYEGAARFYNLATGLLRASSMEVSPTLLSESLLTAWFVDGPEELIDELATGLETSRREAARDRDRGVEAGLDPFELPDPDAILPLVSVARVRVAAASSLRDEERMRAALDEGVKSLNADIEDLTAMLEADPGAPGLISAIGAAHVELAMLRLWCGMDLDLAGESMAAARDIGTPDPTTMRRLEGWLALRQGRFDDARAMLEALPARDIFGEIGLAMRLELMGEPEKAASLYAEVARRDGGTLAGLWAYTSVETLTGEPPTEPALASRMRELSASVPTWMDRYVIQPRSFLTVEFEVGPSALGWFDEAEMTIVIRNRAPIPLAFGPDRVIDGRFLVSANTRRGADNVYEPAGSRVINIDSRLRLVPNEAVRVRAGAGVGMIQNAMLANADRALRMRWRLLQGFRSEGYTAFVPGPGGARADSTEVFRPALDTLGWSVQELDSAIRAGSMRDALKAMGAIQVRETFPVDDPRTLLDRDRRLLGFAIAARFEALTDPVERLAFILATPFRGSDTTSWLLPLWDKGVIDADPRVRMLTLVLSAGGPSNPTYQSLRDDPDPRVAALARARAAQWERMDQVESETGSP